MINALKVTTSEANFHLYHIDESKNLKTNPGVVTFSALIEAINRSKPEFCDLANIRGSKRGLMIASVQIFNESREAGGGQELKERNPKRVKKP